MGGKGGYNGGGNGGNGCSGLTLPSFGGGGNGGGGATHIAFKTGLLKEFKETYKNDVLLVAGGQGGGYLYDAAPQHSWGGGEQGAGVYAYVFGENGGGGPFQKVIISMVRSLVKGWMVHLINMLILEVQKVMAVGEEDSLVVVPSKDIIQIPIATAVVAAVM